MPVQVKPDRIVISCTQFGDSLVSASHYATHLESHSSICEQCKTAKQRRNYAKARDPSRTDDVKTYGHVRCDWYDTGPKLKTFGSCRYSRRVKDQHAGRRGFTQSKSKRAVAVVKSINMYYGALQIIQLAGDNAPEFKEASLELTGKPLNSSVPYRPTSNSIERDMELVGDAIRVSLQTCGLGPFYAHLAGRCWSQNMNITEKQPQLGNVTAHDFINATRPFKGRPQAFGRNCTAVQPKQLTDASDKPEPRGVDAIFLGWQMLVSEHDHN